MRHADADGPTPNFTIDPLPAQSPEGDEPLPVLRLPSDARPTHTALSLELDPHKPGFFGNEVIALQLDKPRSVIWLNGQGLHVTAARLDLAGARLDGVYQQVNEEGLARVTLPCLVSGKAALHLAWDAPWDTQLTGLHVLSAGGAPYVFSQFAAIDARRAFPSFDEPVFKAPWDLELVIPAGDTAITNAPQVSEQPLEGGGGGGGRKRVRFATTLPLPSYLLAFAVGPFDVVPAPLLPPGELRKAPLLVRGVAAKGRGPDLAHALLANARLLPWLEQWFGAAFPYEKLDHIAVPDFIYGAMENAGAITYRDSALLFREGVSSPEARAGIAGTMAHEMAHQWFGDQVTPRFWTDAWLNESFATWLGSKAEQALWPQDRAEFAQQLSGQGAMQQDALPSARAIRKPVLSLSEVWNQFDALTYQKGAAVLAMFERWVGPDKFQAGIRGYLTAHKDGSGDTDDLLHALSDAAARDVAAPLRTFLDQPGLPLVRAEVVCKGKGPRVVLTQERLLPVGVTPTAGQQAQLWQVPVCVRAAAGREVFETCTLLAERQGAFVLPGSRCPDWVMPNAGGSGYYQWAFKGEGLKALLATLPRLPLRERLSLAASLQAAWSGGLLPAGEVLSAAELLSRDEDGAVSMALAGILASVREEIAPKAQQPAAEAWVRDLYRPSARRLGWTGADGEEPRLRRQRAQTLGLLANVGRDPEVRAEAARRGRAWLGKGPGFEEGAVPAELAGLALSVAVEDGDEALFDVVTSRLGTSEESGVRGRLLGALGAVRDAARVRKALALSLDPRLRSNERARMVHALLAHPESREAAWEFLRTRWDELAPLVPERAAVGMAAGAVAAFCEPVRGQQILDEVAVRTSKLPAAALELQQALDGARLCAAQTAAHRKSAGDFLAKRKAK
jgi:alanyl aminopeptidase